MTRRNDSLQHGIAYLLKESKARGIVGRIVCTREPVFRAFVYLMYYMYRQYFPLLALDDLCQATAASEESGCASFAEGSSPLPVVNKQTRYARRIVTRLLTGAAPMTITVEIKPEVEAELAAQAAARGMDVQAYAALLLEQVAQPHGKSDAKEEPCDFLRESPLVGLELSLERDKDTAETSSYEWLPARYDLHFELVRIEPDVRCSYVDARGE